MWLVMGTALAWDLADPVVYPTDLHPSDASAVGTADGGWLALANGFVGLRVHDVATGARIAAADEAADHVAWLDGGSGLVTCGAGGTWVRSFDGIELGPPDPIADRPCTALLRSRHGGVRLVIDGQSMRYTAADGLSDDGPALVGASRLAETELATAVAVAGTRSVRVDDGDGVVADVETAESLGHLVGDDVEFFYGGVRSGAVVSLSGALVGDMEHQPLLLTADVDGDGLQDLVGHAGSTLSIRSTLSTDWLEWPSPPDMGIAAAVPLAGSDCASVVYAGPSSFAVAHAVSCHGDADGDGFSSEEGDCDDRDPARSPGHRDICDGLDNDCSGVADDATSIDVTLPPSASEGDTVDVGFAGGCPAVLGEMYFEGGQAPFVECSAAGGSGWCRFAESGIATVRVLRAHDDVGPPLILFEGSVAVANLPPALWNEEVYEFPIGREHTANLFYEDPGGDDVTVEVLSGPGFLTLGPGHTLMGVAPRAGSWTVRLRLTDEEGATSEGTIAVQGVRVVTSSGRGCRSSSASSSCSPDVECGCSSAVLLPGWGLFLLVALLRRGPTPEPVT